VTKAEIEDGIRRCLNAINGDSDGIAVAYEYMDILRDRLSKLDGPAEGYERVWIEIERNRHDILVTYLWPTEAEAKDNADAVAVVVADIPKRTVPVVVGEVLP
jgi:hypothetical protein